MAPTYRPLRSREIRQLRHQGCSCDDWSAVQVAESFQPDRIWSTHFCGPIRLGVFDGSVEFFGGVRKPAGIRNATLHNCTVGNNVYINHIRNYIANYHIEDDAVIDNVDILAVEGPTSFGNGTEVAVINEAGGREVPTFDRLSAQLAYILALYRHRPVVIEKLRSMIEQYVATVRSDLGRIGRAARLLNCRILKNVRIGPAAVLEGVNRLQNGSINSTAADPVYIGPGVFAEDFIAASGSTITDGTVIKKCFVGQGTELAKHYSAENSIFFANCGGYHGEACSVFAGPYTVTHHKSTLLIAGIFSFLNAGSGTNQSNHMYKLGPVHQGVVERGSKTASDSYILWPAHIGAFTVVMGRHYRNPDSSLLPFSYLIEHEDQSILVPAVNLRSVGTVRDARKWPGRDRRKDPDKLDHINFKLLSPYTIAKMIDGAELLRRLQQSSGPACEYYTYNNLRISRQALQRGIELYEIATTKFLGNCLLARLADQPITDRGQLAQRLQSQTTIGPGKWLDLAGLFAPQSLVEQLLADIETGQIGSLAQLEQAFASMADNYSHYEWAWAAEVFERRLGKPIDQLSPQQLIELIEQWKDAVVSLDQMLYEDARKEFAQTARIGYGIDGDQQTGCDDFAAVRGSFESNTFANEVLQHIEKKTALARSVIERLEQLV